MNNVKDIIERKCFHLEAIKPLVDTYTWCDTLRYTNQIIDENARGPSYTNIIHAVLLVDDEK